MAAPRAHCQTTALYTGFPVARSHITDVSRWLLMLTAAMFWGSTPVFSISSGIRASRF